MYSSTTELTTKINELQSDILGEKLTNNPLMKSSSMTAKNKALKTTQKTVVNAVNELVTKINNFTTATNKELATLYDILGNVVKDSSLVTEINNRGAETIIALLINTYDAQKELVETVKAIKEKVTQLEQFALDDYEDTFHVSATETKSEFSLTHIPIGKIRIYIDGIRYFSDTISYDESNNTVTWINSSDKEEGFDITDADVVFEYDYNRNESTKGEQS